MNDFWLRLSMAALLSMSGVFGTYMWSRSNKLTSQSRRPDPIARIVDSTNEIQRRPEKRLIWQQVFNNQELYAGEAVRTASDAEAKIEFLAENGTGTVIQLDSDSAIEIHKTQGGIDLDFLKGSLYIRSTDDSQKITVQSGTQTIEVGKSEVQVTKPTSKDTIDIEVYKGKAEVKTNGALAQAKPARIKIVAPLPGKPLYTLPNSPDEQITFEWTPLEPGYEVTLETGESRTELEPLKGLSPVSGAIGKLKAALPVGKSYYRLVARSTNPALKQMTSSVTRAEIRAMVPPTLLEPAMNAPVQAQDDKGMIAFHWGNPGQLTDLIIEVSDKADLSEKFYNKRVGSDLTVELSFLKPGERYWRVSGRLPGSDKMVSSAVRKFFVQPRDKQPLTTPKFLSSYPQGSIPLIAMRDQGIKLQWQAVRHAKTYEITIEGDQTDSQEPKAKKFVTTSNVNNVVAKNLPTGNYRWKVSANDGAGLVSPESDFAKFAVEGVPLLAWSDRQMAGKVIYKTEKPTLQLSWERGPGQPVQWRIRFAQDRAPASDHEWTTTTAPLAAIPLEDPGTYIVEAEALDAKGIVLARTAPRTQEFEQAPPLAPPGFADSLGSEVKASENGAASVKWSPVTEAKSYVLQVKSADGSKVLQTIKTDKPKAELNKLKPGEYLLTLQTVDALDRLGPESDGLAMKVPEYSNVSAPKLKTIKVK